MLEEEEGGSGFFSFDGVMLSLTSLQWESLTRHDTFGVNFENERTRSE